MYKETATRPTGTNRLPGLVGSVYDIDIVIRLLSSILARVQVFIVCHSRGSGAVDIVNTVDEVISIRVATVFSYRGLGRHRDAIRCRRRGNRSVFDGIESNSGRLAVTIIVARETPIEIPSIAGKCESATVEDINLIPLGFRAVGEIEFLV